MRKKNEEDSGIGFDDNLGLNPSAFGGNSIKMETTFGGGKAKIEKAFEVNTPIKRVW